MTNDRQNSSTEGATSTSGPTTSVLEGNETAPSAAASGDEKKPKSLFEAEIRQDQVKSRIRWIRATSLIVAAFLLVTLIQGLVPYFSDASQIVEGDLKRQAIESVKQAEKEYLQKTSTPGDVPSPILITPSTWAVSFVKQPTMTTNCSGPPSSIGGVCTISSVSTDADSVETKVDVAWDRVLLPTGAILILVAIYFSIENIIRGGENDWTLQSRQQYYITLNDTERHFYLDVIASSVRAESLFARSGLMLVSGVIVAFIGVTVFALETGKNSGYSAQPDYEYQYFRYGSPSRGAPPPQDSVPEKQGDLELLKEKHNFYLDSYRQKFVFEKITFFMINIRFVLIFAFMEAIAWFLLKQYRALMEDYKMFYRLYLKRQNYFTSFVVMSDPQVKDQVSVLTAALLQENLSGTLKSDEKLDNEAQLGFADRVPASTTGALLIQIIGALRGKSASEEGGAPEAAKAERKSAVPEKPAA